MPHEPRRPLAVGLLIALVLVAFGALAVPATRAFAQDAPSPASAGAESGPVEHAAKSPDGAAHPGAGVAAGFAIAALVLAALVGFGCAVAILHAMFPRIADAVDRQARATSPTVPMLVGSLVLVGVAAIVAGAAHGGHGAGGLAFVVLGIPAALLLFAGLTATVPLLGERLLGARGASASPLRRAIVGSVALGLGVLPGFVPALFLLAFVVMLAAFGWPLGVGLAALLARWRRPATASSTPPAAPPTAISPTPPTV